MTGTACDRIRLLVQADHDGELGAAEAAEVAAHLDACADCRAVQAELAEVSRRLRTEASRIPAPESLRRRLLARAAPASPPRAVTPRLRRAGWPAATALALAACVALAVGRPADDPAAQTVASHIRAMQPGHLTDVVSSDQHTVKPWFNGRLDYAPPVQDFAAEGFPLTGGRLDYLDGREVAALVYRHARHVIDLYVWPGQGADWSASRAGYNLVSWSAGGMRFTAISDLNARELTDFAALWRQATP